MPQLHYHNHEQLLTAGYRYDAKTDRYFNNGSPAWEVVEMMEGGKRQGAFPSRTLDEFRQQETAWISSEWSKIKELRVSTSVHAANDESV
jgi:hypothetical protein